MSTLLKPKPGMPVRGPRAEGPSAWMVVPALVFFLTFAVVPLLGVVFLSFTNWNGLGPITWAGLESWQTALTD